MGRAEAIAICSSDDQDTAWEQTTVTGNLATLKAAIKSRSAAKKAFAKFEAAAKARARDRPVIADGL